MTDADDNKIDNNEEKNKKRRREGRNGKKGKRMRKGKIFYKASLACPKLA